MNDFLRYPVPALGDSHSQIIKIAQVVKDPGRELGEVVVAEIPFGQKQGQGQKQPHSQSQTKQYEQAGGGRRDERQPQRGTMTDHERADSRRQRQHKNQPQANRAMP